MKRFLHSAGLVMTGLFIWTLPAEADSAPLSLIDAIRTGLKNSPELASARLEVAEAELDEPLFLSELDTRLESSYDDITDELPRTAPAFEGSRSDIESFNVSLIQNTLLGTEAKVVWDNEKISNPSLFRALDPTAESTLTVELSQPLLRYFWGRPDNARRRRFRANVVSRRESLRHKENNTAFEIARATLELHYQSRRLQISENARRSAESLLKSHREKKRYGLVEDSDVWQAEASLEAEETEGALAQSDRQQALHRLESLLYLSDKEGIDPVLISTPVISISPPLDVKGEIDRGLEKRGDVKTAIALADTASWAVRIQVLDTLPDLSLTGKYGSGGLASDYSRAWDDLGGFDHTVKSIGLNLKMPFGFRKERLERRLARTRLESARQEALKVQSAAEREIKDAYENLDLRIRRTEARRRLLVIQRKKLKAETANFQRGRSTTDLLVRFQQDIHRAEMDLARAETDEQLAQLEMARATGTLLAQLKLDQP